jgi:uncharacterized protein (UPF0332 family)
MTGDDIIFLASQLIAHAQYGHAGARYRSAVSRAYYGAFHLVLDFLQEFGVDIVKNHNGHVEAYRTLFQTDHPTAMRAARMLDELRGDRNIADYHLEKPKFDNPKNAIDRVEMAAEISGCLKQCRCEPDRTALAEYFDRP